MFEFYKLFYSIGGKLPKRERHGIYAIADRLCLDITQDFICAALEQKLVKRISLARARIRIETLKRFIRLMRELNIVHEKWYLQTEKELQEISKMTSGWLRYLE